MAGSKSRGIVDMSFKALLSVPGARVDRDRYLRKELSKHFPSKTVRKAVEHRPALAGIPSRKIDRLARARIRIHRNLTTTKSMATGAAGGPLAVPAAGVDIVQVLWHSLVLAQKLAYLYGWPQITHPQKQLDDETLYMLKTFLGVMHGVCDAEKIVAAVSKKLAETMAKRLPRKALTRYGAYNLAKRVARALGYSLTKKKAGKIAGRAVPLAGIAVCGGITWVTFGKMSNRLREHLGGLMLAKATTA
jgi:hypothetical protein